MQNKPTRSRMHLIFSVPLLVLSVLSGYLLFHYFDLRSTLHDEMTSVAQSTADRLARQLAAPLWSINEQQINSTIDSEMAQPQLVAAEIVDPTDNRVLFEYNRNSASTPSLFDPQAPIVAKKPIITEAGEPIGIAVVHVSQPFMQTALRSMLSQRAVELLLIGTFLSLAYLLIIRSYLIVPLKQATDVIRSSSEVELDTLIQGNRHSELSALLQAVGNLRKRLALQHGRQGD